MKTLLIFAVVPLALASGCASSRSANNTATEFPRYDAKTGGTTIKPLGIAQKTQPIEMAPAAAPPPEPKAYAESYDPSGWMGTSTPRAIGGGPAENEENPYEEPEEATPPNKTK